MTTNAMATWGRKVVETEGSFVAGDLKDSKSLYLHCILPEFVMPFSTFPVLAVKLRLAHVSFPGNISDIRYALLSDRDGVYDDEDDYFFPAPMLISVDKSCTAEWLMDDRDGAGMVTHRGTAITEWHTLAYVPGAGRHQKVQTRDGSSGPKNMPDVDICRNCKGDRSSGGNEPPQGEEPEEKVGGRSEEEEEEGKESNGEEPEEEEGGGGSDSDRSDDDNGSDDSDAGTSDDEDAIDYTEYAEVIKISGCHKDISYQRTLETIQSKMHGNVDVYVPVKIEFQPDNPMDVNAIVVMAELDDTWHPIGMIPKGKIIKITNALRDNVIRSCRFERPPYSKAIKDGVLPVTLACSIILVKVGKWDFDSRTYSYNDYI